jgi:hypothetical protein
MKEKIKEFIHRRDNVSFPELMRAIPDSAGGRVLCHDNDNLILWEGMSQPFVDAIQELQRDGEIVFRRVSARDATFIHIVDRAGLRYPIAKRIQKYARPRWLPIVLCKPARDL